MFGCQTITVLFEKLQTSDDGTSGTSLSDEILNRVFIMLLHMESKKVRQQLTQGLKRALQSSNLISNETLSWIADINYIKKGLADTTLDFDKVLTAIKNVTEIDQMEKNTAIQPLEIKALTYNIF